MENFNSYLAYESFIADEAIEQAKMTRFLEEAGLIMEGNNTISNINIITESFADKFKAAIQKVINAVINMWHKFVEGVSTLFKTEKGYLEQYKDIILKKQVKINNVMMYDYPVGMNKLVQTRLKPFNYTTLKDKLETEDIFRKELLPGWDGKRDFNEYCKELFQGSAEEKEFKGSQLNMTNIYNFCHEFDKFTLNIENDIKNINKVGNQAQALIDQAVRNMPQQQQQQATGEAVFEKLKYFSYVYESVIHELEINTTPNTSANTQAQSQQNVANGGKSVDGNHDTKEEMQRGMNGGDADAIAKHINTYVKVSGTILGAKMTISRNCFKDYMSIIKAHVRMYVGNNEMSNDNENNKPKDIPSNNQKPQDNQSTVQKGVQKIKSMISK